MNSQIISMKQNMKYIVIMLFSMYVFCLNAQESRSYYSLIENTLKFRKKGLDKVVYDPSFFSSSKEGELAEINNLLNLDLIRYYKLWNTYDTELKVKVFLESEKGKELYQKMKQEYDKLKSSTCSLIFDLPRSSSYDLTSKCIKLSFSVSQYSFGNIENYIEFYQLCLSLPTSIKTEKPKKIFGGSDYFYVNTIYIPIDSESKALEVENNIKNCAILVIFNKLDTVKKKTALFTESFILGRSLNVYLINTRDGNIYTKL